CQFPQLVARATTLAGDRANHGVVLSVPGYSGTPVGSRVGDHGQKQPEMHEYKGDIPAPLHTHAVKGVNSTHKPHEAQDDSSLVARDGLHPSAKMYAEWVGVIRPVVARIFGRQAQMNKP